MLSVTQTGLNATQKELNVLSNNLANASTIGFKRSYTNFGDIFSNDPASNPKTSIGMGITTQSVSRDTTQGALKSTSNVTDLAIDGQGYFVLSTNLPTEPIVPKLPPVIPPFNVGSLTLSKNIQPPPPLPPSDPITGDCLPIRSPQAPSFPNGDFTDQQIISSDGNLTKISGWDIWNQQVKLGIDSVGGLIAPNDPTPFPKDPTGTLTSRGDGFTPVSASFVTDPTSINNGSNDPSLHFISSMTTSAGGDVVHGPYVVSADPVLISQGATVSFDWRAQGGSDAYDVFGYLLNVDTGNTIELLNETGSGTGDSGVINSSIVIPTQGNYKFVFASGTFDETFGQAAGASLYIDNIKILGNAEPPSNSTMIGTSLGWSCPTTSGICKNVFQVTAGSGSGNFDGFGTYSPYISFGFGGSAGERIFALDPQDLSNKSSISFDIIKGNNNNGGDSPEAGEGLILEYSINGANFEKLNEFSVTDNSLDSWANKVFNLPPNAQSPNTIIRFRQPASSGPSYDHWGLANIVFNNTPPNEPLSTASTTEPKYDWVFNNISGSARNVFRTSGGVGTEANDGFSGKNSYIIFGGDGSAGERYLTYNPLDLSMKQNISFDIIRGNGTNGGDSPNINAEGLSLLYSIDNGVTFKTLKSYSFNDPSLTNWMTDSIALPKEAQTESTILKFYQPQSSGAPYDHWGLANIAFTDTPPKPEVVPQLVYSRAGNFGVDKDGYVVNPSGFKLMGTDIKTGKANKAVRIPSSDPVSNQPLQAVSINNKGVVSATYGAGPSVELYRISIATFASDAGLKPLGNVAFAQTGASGAAKISNAGEKGGGNIMAGTLEQANVDITNELMAMIAAQQIYNGNSRMLQTQIEALKRLTDNI